MRITIVYRYFWPDTPPYAVMLRAMTRWFAEAGHEVEVITAQPAYKPEARIGRQPWRETVDGVRIRRLPLLRERSRGLARTLNGGLFIVLATLTLAFGRRRDLVWTATMPPVLQALAVLLAGRLRGARFLYHMMDIYPEIGIASGTLRAGPLASLLKRLDRFTLNRAEAAVVLSRDMAAVLQERGARPGRIEIINNFALSEGATPQTIAPRPQDVRRVRFVFAGNIGRFQNLEALVRAFGALGDDNVVLELVGEGRAKTNLQRIVTDECIGNARFHDHLPVDEAFAFMQTCDVAVVSLAPGLYRYAFPSKIMTYLAAGLPILAMVEPDSEIGRLVSEHGLGRVVDWSAGVVGITQAIADMAAQGRGGGWRNGQANDLFHPDVARERWLDLLRELEREGGTTA